MIEHYGRNTGFFVNVNPNLPEVYGMNQVSPAEAHHQTIDALLQDANAGFSVVATNFQAITALTTAAAHLEDPPNLQVAAPDAALKPLETEFTVGWQAAELINRGELEFKTTDQIPDGTRLTNGDHVWAVTTTGDTPSAVSMADSTLVEAIETTVSDLDDSTAFQLRTVGRTNILDTLADTFEPAVADDFEAGIKAAAPVVESPLSSNHIALLVAARHELLQYDLGRWGDDTGFASQATLSRQKQSLEDAGLVETSKVQCDIGRPRYRLHLSGSLAGVGDVAGVVKACEEVLAAE